MHIFANQNKRFSANRLKLLQNLTDILYFSEKHIFRDFWVHTVQLRQPFLVSWKHDNAIANCLPVRVYCDDQPKFDIFKYDWKLLSCFWHCCAIIILVI